MEARRFILSFALLVVCAIAVQAQEQRAPTAEQPSDADRSKRFVPVAYAAPAVGTVSGYSYLARYPNSVSGVHYPAPVYTAAAVAPVAPVVSAYHAPVVSAYHAPVVSAYHAPIVY